MTPSSDRRWMRRALTLAQRYVGATAPNPAVGAVLVDAAGRLLADGAHTRAGAPHAEAHALAVAGAKARGATLYVTLEPCCHHGRTPPCADAIIAAGVHRVVVGCIDPSSKVSGRGIAKLRTAGVVVDVGVETERATDLIADFAVWLGQQRPYLIHKVAMTLDGATASLAGRREVLTGAATQHRVHRLRATCDAVMVGAGTWRNDDPDLMPRRVRGGITRQRVVVATALSDAPTADDRRDHQRTWWLVRNATDGARRAWTAAGARVDVLGDTQPRTILAALWAGGVHRILLEGGATLARSFLDADLIDRWVFAYSAKLAGGRPDLAAYAGKPTQPLNAATSLRVQSIAHCGEDLWLEAVRNRNAPLGEASL